MQVTYSRSDKKKGAEKTRYSLSLNKNVLISEKNCSDRDFDSSINLQKEPKPDPFQLLLQTEVSDSIVEKSRIDLQSENFSFEVPTAKRPSNTYFKTVNAAKKLKVCGEDSKENTPPFERKTSSTLSQFSRISAMLNGHHNSDNNSSGSGVQRKPTIATLSNLGNTCFLNSVLYTLRFAPSFLHNLHHLVADLAAIDQKLGTARLKSSSLGRSAAGLTAVGSRSWSSKDLLSLGQSDHQPTKSKFQMVTERLHETYANLKAAELKCSPTNSDGNTEPFAADAFFTALRDLNNTFEGNRQQDAHELWVCVIDSIRETCSELKKRALHLQKQEMEIYNSLKQQSTDSDGSFTLICSKPSLGNLRKSWKKRKKDKKPKMDSPTKNGPRLIEDEEDELLNGGTKLGEADSNDPEEEDARSQPGWDFITEDFEGTTVLRTTCIECETVTETKQAMCDISVPIAEEGDKNDCGEQLLVAACTTSECLRDQNKYWCGECLRYNEAKRSVSYETLPRLLVLNLKRFSDGMEKITRHAATPLTLRCFCEACSSRVKHHYLLWAVIMHLGQTLSGGHYVAYARYGRATGGEGDTRCPREERAPPGGAERPGLMRMLFTRGRAVTTTSGACGARECCSVRRPEADGDAWLACDDEIVKTISAEEFKDLLSAKPEMRSAATPYLLFYVKSEDG